MHESFGQLNRGPETSISAKDQALVLHEKEKIGAAAKRFIKEYPNRDPLTDEILRKFLKRLGEMTTPAEINLHKPKLKHVQDLLDEGRANGGNINITAINGVLGEINAATPDRPQASPRIKKLGD